MPGLRFEIPVGAAADLKELEFIIALQQTSKNTRSNATVSSQDIKALLKSRYGLNISHKQAIEVVRTLGGGDSVVDQSPSLLSTKNNVYDTMRESHGHALGSSVSLARKLFARKTTDKEEEEEVKEEEKMPSSSKRLSKMDDMKRLHRLHLAYQKTGREAANPKDLSALSERVKEGLQRRVLKKYAALRHFDAARSGGSCNANANSEEAELLEIVKGAADDDDDDDVDADDDKSSGESGEVLLPDSKGEDKDCAEFLDLVQILTTLLIPSVARLAHDIKQQQQHTDDDDDEGVKPPSERGIGTLPGEIQDPPLPEDKYKGVFRRLYLRLENYGQRKLNLDADNPPLYSSAKILEKAKQALIQRALPSFSMEHHVVVDESLVKLLLISHGEVERAMNKKLVREMVEVARSSSGFLDDEALINAISSDLSLWIPIGNNNNNNETTPTTTTSTFFDDVFGTPAPRKDTILFVPNDDEQPKKPVATTTTVEEAGLERFHLPSSASNGGNDDRDGNHNHDDEPVSFDGAAGATTTSMPQQNHSCTKKQEGKISPDFRVDQTGVDFVLDTQISFSILATIWISFILTTAVYASLIFDLTDNISQQCQGSEFWCLFVETVVNWAVVGAVLSTFGLIYVLPLSLGNAPSNRTLMARLIATCVAIVYAILPSFFAKNNRTSSEVTYTGVLRLQLTLGMVLAVMFFLQAVFSYCFNTDRADSLPFLVRSLVSTNCWNVEMKVNRAAYYKLDKLISHALRLHEDDNTRSVTKNLGFSSDLVMRNFFLCGERQIEVGGIIWTWWQIANGNLFEKEGIWINARMRVIQVAQVILGLAVTVAAFVVVERGAAEADEARKELENDDLPDYVMEVYPTGEMIRTAFNPAVWCGCISMAVVTALYIPSAVGTILKYRCQMLPSLGSTYFEKYRVSLDTTYFNTGNAIYGMVGMAFLVYLLIGGIIFLFLWPPTKNGALMLLAWCLGLGVTICLKMALTMTCRMIQYRAFYRIRPSAACVTSLALECWYLGLASSVLLARIGQFLFAAVFWIGRIDVTFLSEDVNLFGYTFDYVPTHFFKELLVHEAHRHPYIERLAQMYLMKLRHGDRFVSDAGSAWRQLLIVAMLPWVNKYRVFSHERQTVAEIDKKELEELEVHEARIYNPEILRGVGDLGGGLTKQVFEAGEEVIGTGLDVVEGGGDMVNVVRRMTKGFGDLSGDAAEATMSVELSGIESIEKSDSQNVFVTSNSSSSLYKRDMAE